MNKISESHLRSLGFQKEVVPIDESGNEVEFYYYSLDINYLTLITESDDEIIDNQWSVHIMETGLEKIYDLDDLVKLLHLLKKYEVK